MELYILYIVFDAYSLGLVTNRYTDTLYILSVYKYSKIVIWKLFYSDGNPISLVNSQLGYRVILSSIMSGQLRNWNVLQTATSGLLQLECNSKVIEWFAHREDVNESSFLNPMPIRVDHTVWVLPYSLPLCVTLSCWPSAIAGLV